jgi:hypothetical protein
MSEITLRELFAAHALQGLLASGHYTIIRTDDNQPDFVETTAKYYESDGEKAKYEEITPSVQHAWILAELMLSERNKLTAETDP